jgi:predicted MFS family arabinose efflux permease
VLGWRAAWLVLGAATLLIGLPIVFGLVRERPAAAAFDTAALPGTALGEAFRSRVLWTLIASVFCGTLALNAVIVHMSALLTDRGLTAAAAAIVMSAMGAASLAGRLFTGWLLDRYPAVRVSVALLLIAAFGTYLLSGAASFTLGVVAAACIGFGSGGEVDVTPYLLSRYFGMRALSTLYGLNWTVWGLAGVVGPTLMGRAFDATGSYERTLIALGSLTLAAAALTLSLPPWSSPELAAPSMVVRKSALPR